MKAQRFVVYLLALGLLCISLGSGIDYGRAYPFTCQAPYPYQCYCTNPAFCYPANCHYTFQYQWAPLQGYPYPCSYPFPFGSCSRPCTDCPIVYPTPYPAYPMIYPG